MGLAVDVDVWRGKTKKKVNRVQSSLCKLVTKKKRKEMDMILLLSGLTAPGPCTSHWVIQVQTLTERKRILPPPWLAPTSVAAHSPVRPTPRLLTLIWPLIWNSPGSPVPPSAPRRIGPITAPPDRSSLSPRERSSKKKALLMNSPRPRPPPPGPWIAGPWHSAPLSDRPLIPRLSCSHPISSVY